MAQCNCIKDVAVGRLKLFQFGITAWLSWWVTEPCSCWAVMVVVCEAPQLCRMCTSSQESKFLCTSLLIDRKGGGSESVTHFETGEIPIGDAEICYFLPGSNIRAKIKRGWEISTFGGGSKGTWSSSDFWICILPLEVNQREQRALSSPKDKLSCVFCEWEKPNMTTVEEKNIIIIPE